MKRRLLFFALLLAALPLRTLAQYPDFSAIAPTGQTLYYYIIGNDEVQVLFCDGEGALAIPASVTFSGTTYAVTSIMDAAFWECRGLTSVTIPSSITTIGNEVFFGCDSLTSIHVESGNTVYDSRNGCNAIIETSTNTLIAGCKNTMIPNTIAIIGRRAFCGCISLTLIAIPNSVISIEYEAFAYCDGLTSITIPSSVTSIDYSFSGCSNLASIVVEAGNTVYDSRNGCNAIIETATNRLIAGCKNTVIPNTVTTIGDGAFNGCDGLTSITIPSSVTSIDYSFSGCSNLASIVVEAGNTVYDSRNGCNAIIETATNRLIAGCKNTVIPNTVTTIGEIAFSGCSGLMSITIPNSVIAIEYEAFCGCSGLTSVTIPNSVAVIGHYAFAFCRGLTSVTIGNSVHNIGDRAFAYCDGLTSLTIPSSTTFIGQLAFGNCSGLASIQVEAGNAVYDSRNSCNAIIETATNRLIAGCKNTVIPNTVTTIGEAAFYDCSGLSSVTIPNSVTTIGEEAFENCRSLTSVTIGGAVDSIGSMAFAWCDNLAELHCKAAVPPALGVGVFYLIGQEIPVYVPCDAADTYRAAAGWNEFTNIQEDCMEGIGDVDGRDGLQVWSVDGSIHVSGFAEGMEVRVYDITGRRVGTSGLRSGVYLVNVGTLPARKVVVIVKG